MKRDDFRLFHRLRVRWAEVDMQKIVFNAHYLAYFDLAINDYWRALAMPYEDAMRQLGGELYLKKAAIDYHGSARFDDQLDIALKCGRIGTSSMTFTGAIFRGDQMLASCELVYVFADPASQTSRPVPDALRHLAGRFEAGEAVFDIVSGDWATLAPDAAKVRTAVFVQEQGVPQEMEWDAHDPEALHVVVRNGLGQAVATARLVDQAGPGVRRVRIDHQTPRVVGIDAGQEVRRQHMTLAQMQQQVVGLIALGHRRARLLDITAQLAQRRHAADARQIHQ